MTPASEVPEIPRKRREIFVWIPVVALIIGCLLFGRDNSQAPRDARYWCRQLGSRRECQTACVELLRLGADALPALAEELNANTSPAYRGRSYYFRFWSGLPAWLRKATPQPAIQPQQVAVSAHVVTSSILAALESAGPREARAIPVLKPLTDNASYPYRSEAALALWSVSQRPDLVLPFLEKEIAKGTGFRPLTSLGAAGYSVGKSALIAPQLSILLEGPDHGIACLAAEVLGSIGTNAQAALPALQRAARSGDDRLARHSQEAIARVEMNPPPSQEGNGGVKQRGEP
ncbi:MAG TPA: hypothetical protein VHH73_18485 [Verrucomicrobiae bacterium]|nr:hypothetical protein [Verrucomicrobiae bacterium]